MMVTTHIQRSVGAFAATRSQYWGKKEEENSIPGVDCGGVGHLGQ